MCGEHRPEPACQRLPAGSSPHVRGARLLSVCVSKKDGIIPACAGSTGNAGYTPSDDGDHPRMCGEHRTYAQCLSLTTGSSPHVRGALDPHILGVERIGIIPACAGSTVRNEAPLKSNRDHPRMCGEHSSSSLFNTSDGGSSPHVRGAQYSSDSIHLNTGIIPACAGSTTMMAISSAVDRDHPRMCGEHTGGPSGVYGSLGSSPHVRGAPGNWRS